MGAGYLLKSPTHVIWRYLAVEHGRWPITEREEVEMEETKDGYLFSEVKIYHRKGVGPTKSFFRILELKKQN